MHFNWLVRLTIQLALPRLGRGQFRKMKYEWTFHIGFLNGQTPAGFLPKLHSTMIRLIHLLNSTELALRNINIWFRRNKSKKFVCAVKCLDVKETEDQNINVFAYINRVFYHPYCKYSIDFKMWIKPYIFFSWFVVLSYNFYHFHL